MKVVLAGYNVDSQVLELGTRCLEREGAPQAHFSRTQGAPRRRQEPWSDAELLRQRFSDQLQTVRVAFEVHSNIQGHPQCRQSRLDHG